MTDALDVMTCRYSTGPYRLHLAGILSAFCLAFPFPPLAISLAQNPNLSVPIPAGETYLADIGRYRVSWQSYGEQPESMPVSWSGNLESKTGITYLDCGRFLERRALLLHSPWRVPSGKMWVDYELALPAQSPIRLKFGIAMGPDAVAPGRGDGATFSCFLTINGTTQQLCVPSVFWSYSAIPCGQREARDTVQSK